MSNWFDEHLIIDVIGGSDEDAQKLKNAIITMIECPEHGGAFDCTPFCKTCEGEQEIASA